MRNTNLLNVKTKKQLQLWTFCIIPMILVFVFNYLPLPGIIIAFKRYRYDKGIFGSDWVGFKNFEFFFQSNDFIRITWNTLKMNFIFIVLGIVACCLVAILLFELRSRMKVKIFHTIMITPHFISMVILAFVVYILLNPLHGVVNQFLTTFGLDKIDFYSKPNAWPTILTICYLWKHVGMDSILYYATLMGLDEGLFDAAYIDGASEWQKIRYIILPSLVPLITLLSILKIGGIFSGDFGLFYNVTRNVGTLYSTTDIIDTYVFRQLRVLGNVGMSSAVGLLQNVVGFGLVIFVNKLSKLIDPEGGLF